MKCIACWSVGSAALLVLAGTALVGFAPSKPLPTTVEAAPAGAANFEIDSVHSSTVFKIQHAGVSNFYGTFQKISGAIVWDKASPDSTSITASIDASSVNSANAKRDEHLKGPDFFNAKEHPAITFKSIRPLGFGMSFPSGLFVGWNASGMNVWNPPVMSCRSRSFNMWSRRCSGFSMCP